MSFLGELKRKTDDIISMRKCNNILKNENFRDILSKINSAEKDRIYCNHGIDHLLDVARSAYILNLENGLNIPKEIIYGTALLHDIGRYEQYKNGINHHKAGGEIAKKILCECGFASDEIEYMVEAVRAHREIPEKAETLGDIIAIIIGNKEFGNHTYVMGILNVTPDSFSDGGKFNNIDSALKHTEQLINDGADIIDVGGESTRLNYTKISDEEEIERVVPVIEKIKANFDVPVSIDTYKSKVAAAAVGAGADLVNDIWGLKYDKNMAEVIAKSGAACCLMHNREKAEYNSFVEDVLEDLRETIAIAKKAGIADDKIILDPGVGFAKSYEQNLIITNNVDRLNELGYPVLLGTSRKSMIGLTLDLPSDQRVEGTVATSVIGVMKGCRFVRVHDVLENKRAILMTEAIINS